MSAETLGGSSDDLPMPSHAFLLAAFLPALAAVSRLAFHDEIGTWALLIWLLGLVPVFLLTRYMGWKGALLGLTWTSTMVVMAELFAILLDGPPTDWSLIGVVVAVTASAALGAGLERQWWVTRRDHMPEPEGSSPGADDLPHGEVLRYFQEKLFEAAKRRPPLTIVLLEVDHYDEYTSMYGEKKAGKAIGVAAQALKSQTRASNMYGQVDDRRLVVFLNGETLSAAYGFAIRVLEEIATLPAPWTGRITLSAGIAGFETAMPNADALVARARQALDTARRLGGERIVVANGTTGETLVTSGMTVVDPDGKAREIRDSV